MGTAGAGALVIRVGTTRKSSRMPERTGRTCRLSSTSPRPAATLLGAFPCRSLCKDVEDYSRALSTLLCQGHSISMNKFTESVGVPTLALQPARVPCADGVPPTDSGHNGRSSA